MVPEEDDPMEDFSRDFVPTLNTSIYDIQNAISFNSGIRMPMNDHMITVQTQLIRQDKQYIYKIDIDSYSDTEIPIEDLSRVTRELKRNAIEQFKNHITDNLLVSMGESR
jgi:hypothetical protein